MRTQAISPIRSRLHVRAWEEKSKTTRRYKVGKAGQGISTLLKDIPPSNTGSLFKAVCSSSVIQSTLQRNGEETTLHTLKVTKN